MLTNLNFLNQGQQFPPKSESARLEMYRHNHALFENKQAEVYAEAFKRIERVVGNFEEVVSFPVIANYQKLITLKLVDLLLGEEPKVVAGEDGSNEQKSADTIKKNTDYVNKFYQAMIDLSRYGDGLVTVGKEGDKGQIDVSQPPVWFPVADPTNIKRILYHVLAWGVNVGTEDKEDWRLYVHIHERGFVEKREYVVQKTRGFSSYFITKMIKGGFKERTPFKDEFAVIQIPNVITSDRIHGMDDYSDIDSIISELLVRLGQIARILDKHASPNLTGPMTALERNEDGKWVLKMGNYFPRDGKEDPEVKYVTWDGHLDANFKMIEQLINLLHAISETGGQLLGDKNEEGGALSGTALRFKLVSPLSKVKRIALRLRPAMEKAIVLCSQIGGKDIVDLSNAPISITFMDGLPNDPKEEAEIMASRTGNKATMSVKRAVMMFDGLSEEDAENELKMIQDETTALDPMLSMNTPFNDTEKKPTKSGEE